MFTESNTVEAYLYDLLSGPTKPVAVNVVQEPESHYGRAHKGLGWRRITSADFPRQTQEVLVEKSFTTDRDAQFSVSAHNLQSAIVPVAAR